MHVEKSQSRFTSRRLAGRIATGLLLFACSAFAGARSDAPAVLGGKILAPQDTSFSYQGELLDGGSLANGSYDLRFRLFDDLAAGGLVGSPSSVTFTNQAVANGLFTVALNFGTSAFAGDERFLEIAVRPGGSAVAFTVLNPRQKVAAAPYAIHALTAGAAARRGFYLTTSVVTGDGATSACSAGYHMASLWEIFNVSVLEYRTALGYSATDSGDGPPSSIAGWIRTGVPSFTNAVPGNANCNSWTSNNAAHNGTRVNLQPQWQTAADFTSPWDSTVQACSSTSRVWCIED